MPGHPSQASNTYRNLIAQNRRSNSFSTATGVSTALAPSEVRLVPIGIYKNFDLDQVREHKPRQKKIKKLIDSKTKISTRPGKGFSITQTVKQADQGGVQGVSI